MICKVPAFSFTVTLEVRSMEFDSFKRYVVTGVHVGSFKLGTWKNSARISPVAADPGACVPSPKYLKNGTVLWVSIPYSQHSYGLQPFSWLSNAE